MPHEVRTTGPKKGDAYIYFQENTPIRRTFEATAFVDVDENGKIVGVELLNLPKHLKFLKHD